jgi:hypothetical protein
VKIIGVGFGRTGTTSVKAALEELGLPCYHMTDAMERAAHRKVWSEAKPGQRLDWTPLFADFQATVDWPACTFYQQLIEQYPDAHVLLTVRDPEKWYESTQNTLYSFGHSLSVRLMRNVVPALRDYSRLVNNIVWEGTFSGRFTDKHYAIEVYERHIEDVKKHVPADRLLIYDVKQGWEPLCRVLNVEVPKDKPFPHLNDTASFQKMTAGARKLAFALLALTGGALALAYYLFH